MNKLWFVYDLSSSMMTFYETEAEALVAAEKAIEEYCEEEEWSDDAGGILVGHITHRSQEVNIQYPPATLDDAGYDDDGLCWEHIDYRCDYAMVPMNEEETS